MESRKGRFQRQSRCTVCFFYIMCDKHCCRVRLVGNCCSIHNCCHCNDVACQHNHFLLVLNNIFSECRQNSDQNTSHCYHSCSSRLEALAKLNAHLTESLARLVELCLCGVVHLVELVNHRRSALVCLFCQFLA